MSNLSESRNKISISPEQFLKSLKAGEHGCVFYFTKEEMHRIHFGFVKSGLENDWGVVYVTATESIANIRSSMGKFGINTHRYEDNDDKSLIIIRGEELYKDPENPDIENWLNAVKSVSDMFVSKKGKIGVRIAADLSSYFFSHGLLKQWHDLEYALEKKLSLPVSLLCAYDANIMELWDTDVLKFYTKLNQENKEFVNAHSFAIYTSNKNSAIFTI